MPSLPIPNANQIGLQFCSFDSTIAGLIQWFTQGSAGQAFSVGHVDVILPYGHPQAGDLLGAQNLDGLGGMPSGVQIRPWNYGASSGMLTPARVLLPTTPEVASAAYEWALSMVGCEYDLRAIEGIALDEDWATPSKFICSGLGAGLLTQPSPSFFGRLLAKKWRCVTPEELMLVCSAFAEVQALLPQTGVWAQA